MYKAVKCECVKEGVRLLSVCVLGFALLSVSVKCSIKEHSILQIVFSLP